MMLAMDASTGKCRVLSLDGGGAKGIYTLGVLTEVEGALGRPLADCFDLIYGTSTGSIIATLLSLGCRTEEIKALYAKHVPTIMSKRFPADRTESLRVLAATVFGDKTFSDVRTGLGVVATRWQFETPMIFKSLKTQAHGRRGTFVPGFGCTLADAVKASCSAYPFFDRTIVKTANGESVELIDGGYCANNPTLFALADATGPLGASRSKVQVVSIGVGNYPKPSRAVTPQRLWDSLMERLIRKHIDPELLQKTMAINTASMDQLCRILFSDVQIVRINETFERPEMATDFMESDTCKLDLLFQRGRQSFASHESDVIALMT